MANYYGKTRTNYFEVKDEEKFEKIMSHCIGGDEVVVYSKVIDGKKKFMFYCDGDIYGLPDNEGDAVAELLLDELVNLVADNDSIIIIDAGSENLRYIHAGAYIITSKKYAYLDLNDCIMSQARNMLKNDKYSTELSF